MVMLTRRNKNNFLCRYNEIDNLFTKSVCSHSHLLFIYRVLLELDKSETFSYGRILY